MEVRKVVGALGAAFCCAFFLLATGAGGSSTSAVAATTSNNAMQCSGTVDSNTDTLQSCTISAAAGTCYERSSSPVVVQICTFNQAGATGDRRATATQIIESKDGAPITTGGTQQDGTQTVNVDQTGGTGSNSLIVSQAINQKLGPGNLDDTEENELEPSGAAPSMTPIVQSQESHQNVFVNQGTISVTGNSSNVLQFLKQRERASHAPQITQHQNLEDRGLCTAADDPNANMCVVVNQTSGGNNVSRLSEDYRQFQRALDTASGEQVQGNVMPFKGGENHQIDQTGPNPKQIATLQNERQTQRAVHTGTLTQAQNGPRKGFGSSQTGNVDDVWRGAMVSTQTQTNRPNAADVGTSVFAAAGTQLNDLEYYGTSTGDIRASLTASERSNGSPETVTNTCPTTNTSSPNHDCAAVIVCGSVSDAAVTQEETGACEANSCEPGEIFDPVDRTCQGIDLLSAPASASMSRK